MNKLFFFLFYILLVECVWFFVLCGFNLLVLLFLFLFILVMILLFFFDSSFLMYFIKGFLLCWYENLFSFDEWVCVVKNSFIVVLVVIVIVIVLGMLVVVGFNKLDFCGKGILMVILILFMIVLVVVVGVGVYLFFVCIGLFDSYFGLILVYVVLGVFFVVMMVLVML